MAPGSSLGKFTNRSALILWAVVTSSLPGSVACAHSEESHRVIDPSAKEVTLRGEVVDPVLFLKRGLHESDDPAQREEICQAADRGQALAILEEGSGELYLLLPEHPGKDPNELVYDFVGQPVSVTGYVYERNGVRGLVVISAEPVAPDVDVDVEASSPASSRHRR